jgi:hypothetical protein
VGDRTVNLMPLWDGSQWSLWIPTGTGLFEMHPVDTSVIDYVAKTAARPTDLWIPFVDLMWQRASWPEICHHISAIRDDFHNMATSVAKIRHFFATRARIPRDALSYFVATELEYILTLCRSVFDLLHEAISIIWNERVLLLDEKAEQKRKRHQLTPKLSKLVLRTQIEIESDYGLPPILAEQYAKLASFFLGLRSTRDNIVHHGHSSPTIFVTQKGFCIDPKAKAFAGFTGCTSAVVGAHNLPNDRRVQHIDHGIGDADRFPSRDRPRVPHFRSWMLQRRAR